MIATKRALSESEVFPEDYGLTKRSKYTREIHMLRLGRMLERAEQRAEDSSSLPWEYLCGMCPACIRFGIHISRLDDMWDSTEDEICTICRNFIGLTWSKEEHLSRTAPPCPCHKLGAEDAYHKTKEAL